ncbi:ribosome silencing factor [uncultured Faecalibaculum sp.]|uniref:ribosome silencing factor n=1 Tax=uncultured Faecalibaculum sp. TaxID=1729681 RepID=UPI0025FB6DA7|nr:ribosome silencing factor [uncultured Faecalibaculum sp.]
MDKLTDVVIDAIEDKKGTDIRVYDMKDLSPFMDTMIVCSTSNLRQNNAVVQSIKDKLREENLNCDMRVEGRQDSKWILVDLQDVVVNVFVQDEREFYGLDRLYRDVFIDRTEEAGRPAESGQA